MWYYDALTVSMLCARYEIVLCLLFIVAHLLSFVCVFPVSVLPLGCCLSTWIKNVINWIELCWRNRRPVQESNTMSPEHESSFLSLHKHFWCLSLCGPVVWVNASNPITGLDRPVGFQEFEAPRFHNNRHMNLVRLSALWTGSFLLEAESTPGP